MSQRAGSRARGFLSRGALLSLLLHVHLLAPIGVVIWIIAGRQEAAREAQRAQEMDVEFQDATAAELPKDLPPIEPPPDQLEPPKPQPPKTKALAHEKKPEAPPQQKPKDEPEKKIVAQPEPKPEEPAPPPPEQLQKAHEKIVDQESEKKEAPPPDAKYLAQDNHRAAKETNARDRTLEKRKNNGKDNQLPTADKDKVAELEDQKSALGRKAPDVTPHENPQVAETHERKDEPKSLLAMRDPAPRTHEISPETADPSIPKAADGDIAMSRPAKGAPADPARVKAGDKVKLALAQKDFEYLFGADAEAERRLAETHRSTRKGKFAQKVARVQAALENFVPEVQPGNTTELSTRAAPFAAYIARMHRSIHKLWGFDQLEAWDELTGSSPLNDPKLATTLEAVINRDGTIDKVTIVRTSGYLGFDAAAIDVLYTAGPFPDPPREIRSPDGKIYVHWTFHRDERQCTPAFTQYFILAEKPHQREKGGVVDRPEAPHAVGGGAAGDASRPAGAGGGGDAPGSRSASATAPAEAPAAPQPPTASQATAPQPTTTGGEGPRRLKRFDDNKHRVASRRLDEEVAAAEEQSEKAAPVPAPSSTSAETQPSVVRAADPAARAIAERWFKALSDGDAAALTSLAVLPFKTSSKDVSKRAALTAMFTDLAGEEKSARARTLQLFTTAGLRAAIGKLPANVDDGSGTQLYALASNGPRDTLILILSKRGTDWKPVGLVRR
jgi:TonB family protein